MEILQILKRKLLTEKVICKNENKEHKFVKYEFLLNALG